MDRYRLAPVRDARARDERAQRANLATVVDSARTTEHLVQAAAARVDAARGALDAARAARAALLAAATRPHLVTLAEHVIARRRRALDAALAEHLRAGAAHSGRLEAIDTARAALARARADREIIERHFARWREARHKLAERRED